MDACAIEVLRETLFFDLDDAKAKTAHRGMLCHFINGISNLTLIRWGPGSL